MKTEWRDGDRTRIVELDGPKDGRYRVRIDDGEFEVQVERLDDGRFELRSELGAAVAEVTAVGTRRFVRLGVLDFVLEREMQGTRRRQRAAGGGLEAPMPGAVTRVMVAVGETVTRGQPLVAVEAMKMEHLIRAPRDGRIKSLKALAGEMVAPGTALVELED